MDPSPPRRSRAAAGFIGGPASTPRQHGPRTTSWPEYPGDFEALMAKGNALMGPRDYPPSPGDRSGGREGATARDRGPRSRARPYTNCGRSRSMTSSATARHGPGAPGRCASISCRAWPTASRKSLMTRKSGC